MAASLAAPHLVQHTDCVLIYPDIVNKIEAFSYRPGAKEGTIELHKDKGGIVDTLRDALGLKSMRVVETGGTDYMRERTQWDSGANLVCAFAWRRVCL